MHKRQVAGRMKQAAILLLALLATCCAREKQGTTAGETSGKKPPLVSLCRDIDYSDTAVLHDRAVMQRHMVKIVKLLPHSDSVVTRQALTCFFRGIRHDGRGMAIADSLGNLYLNNPASPARDGELYIRFLDAMLSVDSIPDAIRLRAQERLRTALLNRVGSTANDFTYIERSGAHGSLHSSGDTRILLVFYDPECPHCGDILDQIAKAPQINAAIAEGELTVLAVYAEGKREVWEHTKADMPANWLVGYDTTGILDRDLYDLPAMPVLYLLAPDKKVILKDPDVTKFLRIR